MSIFNGTNFNDYREKRLAAALMKIHAANDPAAIEDEVIRDHYRRCKAVLFPAEEDFGIVPVEATAIGAPSKRPITMPCRA